MIFSLLIMIFSLLITFVFTVNNNYFVVNNDFCNTLSGLGQHIEPLTRIRTAPLTTRQWVGYHPFRTVLSDCHISTGLIR